MRKRYLVLLVSIVCILAVGVSGAYTWLDDCEVTVGQYQTTGESVSWYDDNWGGDYSYPFDSSFKVEFNGTVDCVADEVVGLVEILQYWDIVMNVSCYDYLVLDYNEIGSSTSLKYNSTASTDCFRGNGSSFNYSFQVYAWLEGGTPIGLYEVGLWYECSNATSDTPPSPGGGGGTPINELDDFPLAAVCSEYTGFLSKAFNNFLYVADIPNLKVLWSAFWDYIFCHSQGTMVKLQAVSDSPT